MKKASMEYLEMAIIPEALEKMEETDSLASKKRASRTKKCCVPTEKTIRAKRRKQNARAKRKTQKILVARGFITQDRWWSKSYIPSERDSFLQRQECRDKFYRSEDQKYKKFLGTVDLEELELENGVTADCVDNENAVEDEKERFAECFRDCFDAFMADPMQFIASTKMYAIEEKTELFYSLNKYLKAVAKVLEKKKVL